MCHGGEQPQDGGLAEDAQGMDEFDWVMKVGKVVIIISSKSTLKVAL